MGCNERLSIVTGCATLVLLALAGCGATDAAAPDHQTSASSLIQDAAHHGGTPGFYFLPPIASLTRYGEEVATGLSPVVTIEEVEGRGAIAAFSTSSGSGGSVIREARQGYYVVWDTRRSGVKPGFVYRIRVSLDGVELGVAEAKVARSLGQVLDAYRNEYVPLIGLPLPIAFRIEPAALQGTKATVDVAGATLRTGGGVVLEIPFGALDGPVDVSIAKSPLAPPPGAVSPLIEFQPDGTRFNRPVRVTLPLPAGLATASVYWSRPDGTGFDALGGKIDTTRGTITVEANHFSLAYVGPGVATRTVSGSGFVTYITPAARESVAQPFTFVPRAIVGDGSSGTVVLPGVATPGAFEIPDVPVGEYILQWSPTDYLVTSSSAVDVGRTVAGRPPGQRTPVPAGSDPAVKFSLTNLLPFQPSDWLVFFSPESDNWLYFFDFAEVTAGALAAGATEGSFSIPSSWMHPQTADRSLINYSQGDRAYAVQIAGATTAAGNPYIALQRAVLLPAFDMSPTGITTVGPGTIPLVGVQQTHSLDVDFQGARWVDPFPGDSNPGPRPANAPIPGFSVEAVPGSAGDGLYWSTVQVVQYVDSTPAGTSAAPGAMTYGTLDGLDPGASWDRIFVVSGGSAVEYRLPGTRGPPFPAPILSNGLSWETLPSTAAGGAVVPPVTQPTSVSVNGASYFAGGAGIGTTPTLAWGPPRIGTPKYYELSVSELSRTTSNSTRRTVVARLLTPNLSVTLPPGILVAGSSYAFQLTALAPTTPAADARLSLSPVRPTIDLARGSVPSGIFQP